MLTKIFERDKILAITVDHALPGFASEPIDTIKALVKKLGTLCRVDCPFEA